MKLNEQEKIEKEYERLLEKFLFGRLGITGENYKKYEEFQGDDFENQKKMFYLQFHLLSYLFIKG